MERADGGDKVYFWHLGPIRVQSQAEALPMDVHVLDYVAPKTPWGSSSGAVIKALSLDPQRNDLIARQIKRMYDAGRQGLVVSDGVAHLQRLIGLAHKLGVPMEAMGQYTGERHEWQVDPVNKLKKRVVKKKLTKHQLDSVKGNAQIIFATYGMMTEGIDIPRLDAGIDATPRGKATQIVGRIRRPVPGKKKPLWVTIRDVRCPRAVNWFKSRCKDYRATGAEVIEHGAEKSGTNARTDRGAEAQVLGGGAKLSPAQPLSLGPGLPGNGRPAGAGQLPQTAGGTGIARSGRGLPRKSGTSS
jgi:hypothetical protein